MEEGINTIESRREIVKAKLDNGIVVYIEATRLQGEAASDEYISHEMSSFKEVTDVIEGISQSLVAVWRTVKPKKANVEFSLEVGFEPGMLTALLVKGSGKANLKVTLEWSE